MLILICLIGVTDIRQCSRNGIGFGMTLVTSQSLMNQTVLDILLNEIYAQHRLLLFDVEKMRPMASSRLSIS